jgi:cytochrome c oxidase cbb3-type subunit 3
MFTSRAVRLAALFLIWCLAGYSVRRSFSQQRAPHKNEDEQATTCSGKRIFSSTCAGCHGLDARGGERAPTLAGSAHVHRLSDAELAALISNGISGTGMPPFHSLSATEVREVVGYIRRLEGDSDTRTVPGDAERGENIFFGKGECSHCHAIAGKGGFIGPDLSTYGSTISAGAIREALLAADRAIPQGYKWATALTRDGQSIEGIVRNEDNFAVQLLTLDGTFHFFDRKNLRRLEYSDRSLMPTDYGARLTPKELDDLVSYLMSPAPGTKLQTKEKEDDPE